MQNPITRTIIVLLSIIFFSSLTYAQDPTPGLVIPPQPTERPPRILEPLELGSEFQLISSAANSVSNVFIYSARIAAFQWDVTISATDSGPDGFISVVVPGEENISVVEEFIGGVQVQYWVSGMMPGLLRLFQKDNSASLANQGHDANKPFG